MSNINADFVIEPERKIPVYKKVDVVVAGSGPGGLGAAISSARNGADTLLVPAPNPLQRGSYAAGGALDP